MDMIDIIRTRRCIRKFSKKEVSDKLINQLVDCGRLAPTARNEQPFRFIVITGKKMRDAVAEETDFGKFISQTPVCIAVVCKETKYFLEDGSAATVNIMLAAHSLGLGSCWVAGDKKSYANNILRLLKVPPGFKLVSLIPVGYPAEKPKPSKKPLKDLIRWDTW
jgi:nitroreductase